MFYISRELKLEIMKKIIIALMFIGLASFASCNKDGDVFCWDCMTEAESESYYSSHRFEICGLTYEERADFEIANSSDNGTLKITTSCKLQ